MLIKYRSLVIIAGISMLLFAIFYSYFKSIEIVRTEDPFEDTVIEQPAFFEEVNYYDLIYSNQKDPAVGLEGKERHIAATRPEPEPAPKPPAGSAASQKEQQMVGYINQARSSAGLPALQVNNSLTSAARAKSKDMVDRNYFSHQSPTYGSVGDLLRRFGLNNFRSHGENLAMNSSGNVLDAHNMLMNSPAHRSNILNPGYKNIGVGIHIKSDGSHYYTQLFIGY